MHIGIFAGGELHPGEAFAKGIKQFDKVIAADSGAANALALDIIPDYVIGDFDSIDKKTLSRLKKKGTEFVRFPSIKDATDTELAVDFAVSNGAKNITILGGIAGNRIDHVLANIFLSEQSNIPIKFIDASSVLWFAKNNEQVIKGAPGDLLSLVPLSQIEGITANGLQYALNNEILKLGKSRGVSNVFVKQEVVIRWTKGRMLFVHTLA